MCIFDPAPPCPVPDRIVPTHWATHLPFAFWLVETLKPGLLVELGTYYGASFCAFCQQIKSLNIPAEAYAVDLWSGDEHMGNYPAQVYTDLSDYVSQHYASFAYLLRMKFDEALEQFRDNSIDLLHLDGCHTTEAILHDFNSWLPKLSSRGVVLIHDICTRQKGYGGVQAWELIKSRFATIAFTHGYGLGIVLIGREIPSTLKKLAGLAHPEQFMHPFHLQGKIYEKLFSLEAQKNSAAEAASEREIQLNETIRALQGLLDEERNKVASQSDFFKDKLIKEQLKIQALTSSISWKLTAPLRKLASLCRSR